jgi:hypothetical protein
VKRERDAGREPQPTIGWHMDTLNGGPLGAGSRAKAPRHPDQPWTPCPPSPPRRPFNPETGEVG